VSTARVAVRPIAALLAAAPPADRWLSPSEAARAARMRSAPRHAQYLAGHWLLRELLAQASGCAAQSVELVERENRPPGIVASTWCAALSHGGDFVAAAISSQAIGIDLESRRPRPALRRLQHLLLNPDEPQDSLDDDALLQRWVLKEAWIKRGHGSALPETLAALRLAPASMDGASLRLWSAPEFHLAVAAGEALVPELGASVAVCTAWCVPGAD